MLLRRLRDRQERGVGLRLSATKVSISLWNGGLLNPHSLSLSPTPILRPQLPQAVQRGLHCSKSFMTSLSTLESVNGEEGFETKKRALREIAAQLGEYGTEPEANSGAFFVVGGVRLLTSFMLGMPSRSIIVELGARWS